MNDPFVYFVIRSVELVVFAAVMVGSIIIVDTPYFIPGGGADKALLIAFGASCAGVGAIFHEFFMVYEF